MQFFAPECILQYILFGFRHDALYKIQVATLWLYCY